MQKEEKTVISSTQSVVTTTEPDSLVGADLGGRYRILEVLGSGGMGTVYKAQHITTEAIVAVKVIATAMRHDKELIQRLRQEAKILAALEHPNVVSVKVIDVDPDCGRCFLVMEYLQGISLAQLIKEKGPLNREQFLQYFKEAASGLAHAHSRGVVHRDVKPGNLMLVKTDGTDCIKVLDFGISKIIQGETQRTTQTGAIMGSPTYMSREQFFGSQVDQRSDIYSLGCCMYQAITGLPPFRGDDPVAIAAQHINNPVPAIADERFKDMESVIARATAKEPDDRYQSMEELIYALENGDDYKPSPPPATNPLLKDKRKTGKVLILTAAVLVAALVTSVSYFSYNHRSRTMDVPDAVLVDQYVSKVLSGITPTPEEVKQASTVLVRLESTCRDKRKGEPLKWKQANLLRRGHHAQAIAYNRAGLDDLQNEEFNKAITLQHEGGVPACGTAIDWAHCLAANNRRSDALKVLDSELEFLRSKHKGPDNDRSELILKGLTHCQSQPSKLLKTLQNDIEGSKTEFLPNGDKYIDRANQKTIEDTIARLKKGEDWSEVYLD